jgi:hypothetical protein
MDDELTDAQREQARRSWLEGLTDDERELLRRREEAEAKLIEIALADFKHGSGFEGWALQQMLTMNQVDLAFMCAAAIFRMQYPDPEEKLEFISDEDEAEFGDGS